MTRPHSVAMFRLLLAAALLHIAKIPVLSAPAWEAPPAEHREGQFWRWHWYERGLAHGNPAYEGRFRVNAPEISLHPTFGRRVEPRENGMMLIKAEEDIIRRTRERTTAEILIQNDHVTKPADFTEETDPAKLPPAGKHWDAFMNHNWLPSLAKKYMTERCDQRALWKAYLKENNLEPQALLKDAVHLNAHGEWLMAECVKAHLRYDPKLGPSPADGWVKTFEVGKDVRWTDGRLRLEFEGNRVVVVCQAGAAPPAAVRIDGRKPSELPELYGFTRAVSTPPGKWLVKWPVIAPIGSTKPLLVEDWTLAVKRADAANDKLFSLTLNGSKTGPDGEGRSDGRFVSPSGRVVIETNDWNASYALSLGGIKPVPEAFEAKWKVESRFLDEFVSPGVTNTATETLVTLASGLPNGKHTLDFSGGDVTPIAAIRVYRPAPVEARR